MRAYRSSRAPSADRAAPRRGGAPLSRGERRGKMVRSMPSTAMRHLQHLAVDIGPRGSTTPQEREAAAYLRERFEAAGLETHWEPFRAPVSGWRPFALAALIGLVSVVLVAFGGRIGALAAAVAMAVATASVFLEMYFQRNPLRRSSARR
jgi:hypothetical protein